MSERQSYPREWTAIEAIDDAAPSKPRRRGRAAAIRAFAERWLAEHFDFFLSEHPFNRSFWQAIQRYMYACRHLGQYDAMIQIAARIEAHAWINPYIFHHTACAYAARGNVRRAVNEVRRALTFGYDRIDEMFADPDLASLAGDAEFLSLKAIARPIANVRRQFLPLELLQYLQTLEDSPHLRGFHDTLGLQFHVPTAAQIGAAFGSDPAAEAAYRASWLAVSKAIVRASKLPDGPPWIDDDFYLKICELPELPAWMHLLGAVALFEEGWFWVDIKSNDIEPRKEFAHAIDALRRMRDVLAKRSVRRDRFGLAVGLDPPQDSRRSTPCPERLDPSLHQSCRTSNFLATSIGSSWFG